MYSKRRVAVVKQDPVLRWAHRIWFGFFMLLFAALALGEGVHIYLYGPVVH